MNMMFIINQMATNNTLYKALGLTATGILAFVTVYTWKYHKTCLESFVTKLTRPFKK